jgi:hypothetical protein
MADSCCFTAERAQVAGTLMLPERTIVRPCTIVDVGFADTLRANAPAT